MVKDQYRVIKVRIFFREPNFSKKSIRLSCWAIKWLRPDKYSLIFSLKELNPYILNIIITAFSAL